MCWYALSLAINMLHISSMVTCSKAAHPKTAPVTANKPEITENIVHFTLTKVDARQLSYCTADTAII